MVIIGGLGSLLGSYLGAALIIGLPIVLRGIKETFGTADHVSQRRAHHVYDRGNAHYFIPDRGAGRFGAALADRKAETQGVAFPVLKVHT